MRRLVALLLIGGCGRTVCERAVDIDAECKDLEPIPEEERDLSCEEGSNAECTSLCFVDAYDEGGCDVITVNTRNGAFVACLEACAGA